MDELTPEAVAAYAADAIAQINDPEGYAREQQRKAINDEYDGLAAVVADDADTIAKLAQIRDVKLAALEPVTLGANGPVRGTAEDLGLSETTGTAKAKWTASQRVEPERDGQPWCTWEDAEEMLMLAARTAMRGGPAAKNYRLQRDEDNMVLTLDLV